MNVKKHYSQMWEASLHKFKNQEFEYDPLIGSENDTRYGLTLLARPPGNVKEQIIAMLDALKATAPNQYYYPASDLHLTVLSIISCRPGFSLDEIDPKKYCELIRAAIAAIPPINIHFRGITASSSAVLVQGFPEGNHLEDLRNSLRLIFKQSAIQHTIDKRYQLQTAHMTVVRFKETFSSLDTFLAAAAEFRDSYFGFSEINQLELVGNNWYQQKEKVSNIQTFPLNHNHQITL